jgi:hypothetical protein
MGNATRPGARVGPGDLFPAGVCSSLRDTLERWGTEHAYGGVTNQPTNQPAKPTAQPPVNHRARPNRAPSPQVLRLWSCRLRECDRIISSVRRAARYEMSPASLRVLSVSSLESPRGVP